MSIATRNPPSNRAWLDFFVIGILLAIANLFSADHDIGWTGTNPTPWLLLPLFMGGRYGFGWGLISGAVASAGLIAMRKGEGVMDLKYFYLCLPALGFIAGEISDLISKKLTACVSKAERLTTTNERLEIQLDVAEEARFQLQERLALHGAETTSLDTQLRALFEPTAPPIFSGLLRLLRDISGVTDAAMYVIEDSSLTRLAVLGDEKILPMQMAISDCEIAQLAIERLALTTCKEVWQQTPGQTSPWIAALPWQGSGGAVAAVLVIHRMQFLSVNWRTFSLMQTICRWVARLIEMKIRAGENQSLTGTESLIVSEAVFADALASAESTLKEHQLASTVIYFEFPQPVSESITSLLLKTLAPILRVTDVTTKHTHGGVRVLLLMEGIRDASNFMERARRSLAKLPQMMGLIVRMEMTENPEASESV